MNTPTQQTLARVRTLAEQEASRRKGRQTRDYNNELLSMHLRDVERLTKRRLTSQELLSPKFRASLKAFMAWGRTWKSDY